MFFIRNKVFILNLF